MWYMIKLWTLAFLLYFRCYFERVQRTPYCLHHHDIVCRPWTFNVSPLLGIIRLMLSWLSAVHGPSRKFDVAPGRGRWLRDLAPRRPVERAPRLSPAGHPEHTAAGRDSMTQHVADRIIRSICIARTSPVLTQHGRAWDADVSFSWQEKLRRYK